ncbi:SRPBCC family protein [Streptomyces sp. NPDC058291]|uniref:SRPBCC family protein n=1 Tax=Streptomyces sp. NPDC058291 TaxID=3346427 RepID=UPI0036F15167
MTDTLGSAKSATSAAGKAAGGNPLSGLAQSEAADRLKSEVQEYLAAQATRLLTGVGHKLGETTNKLNDIAEGNSPGFAKLALDGGKKIAEGKGPVRSALELGASRAKDKVTGALKNLGGGKGGKGKSAGKKPTVIMETIDVGVPLRTAYDQWTQYQDFSTFAKGVKSANRSDDTTSDWQAKVFWSNRSWKAKTTEQVPDDRIAWTSEGAKGTTKGVVSFHELADSLTRILLVIEYYPTGLFEKTGNIWRAQGRRARLDLKNFARFITIKGEAKDSWRGEIRDGEVVRSHDDAVAEEDEENQDTESEENGEPAQDADYEEDGEPEDEAEARDAGDGGREDDEEYEAEDEAPYAEDGEEEEPEEETEGAYEDEEEEGEPEDAEGEYEEYDEEEEPEEEPRRAKGGSRR